MNKRILSFVFALLLAVNIVSVALPDGTVSAADQSYQTDVTQYKYDKTVKLKVKKGADLAKPLNDKITQLRTNKKNKKKITRIVVPAGSYVLKNPIQVYGNIVLDCTNNVTIRCKFNGSNMICQATKQYNMKKKNSAKYGTIKNITICGGTWVGKSSNKSTLMRMSHVTNLTFDGCTFTGGAGKHQVELASIKKCTVKNCTFKNMKVKTSGSEKCEALQFDAPCSTEVYKETYLDGTPMQNVTVTNCTFKNVPRGVGSHSLLLGAYHTNMNISNNTFVNIPEEAIVALGFKNTTISNNEIKNCGGGILVQNFKKGASAVYNTVFDGKKKYKKKFVQNVSCTIENNNVTTVKSSKVDESVGIKVYGLVTDKKITSKKGSHDTIPKGDYRIAGVTVRNNTINCYACGIHLYGTRDSVVSGNTITGTSTATKNDDSIFVEQKSNNVSINNNTMKNAGRYGIMIQHNSTVKEIANNTLNKATEDGIKIYNGCKVTGDISNNTLKDAKNYGIFVQKKCTISAITGNTITNGIKSGIKIYDGSTATKNISNNKITNVENGIFIHQNSSVNGIINNTIDKTSLDSVKLYNKGTVKTEISGNTITNSQGRGISIQSISNNLNINGNKVSKTAQYPMYVNTGNSFMITINNNSFVAPSQDVSCIQVTSGKASCSNNTCENGKYGISIEGDNKTTSVIGPNTYINCLYDVRK